jgi:hypothetical protein
MGVLMIRCPETGRGIQTQYQMDPAQFPSMPCSLPVRTARSVGPSMNGLRGKPGWTDMLGIRTGTLAEWPTDVWGLVTRTWKLLRCRPSKRLHMRYGQKSK